MKKALKVLFILLVTSILAICIGISVGVATVSVPVEVQVIFVLTSFVLMLKGKIVSLSWLFLTRLSTKISSCRFLYRTNTAILYQSNLLRRLGVVLNKGSTLVYAFFSRVLLQS